MGLSDYLRRLLARGALRAYQTLFEGDFDPGFQGVPSDEPEFVRLTDVDAEVVKLAHASDLHIGRHHREKLQHLYNKLKLIGPDFLVISGDVVHEPARDYLQDACSVLEELRKHCKVLLVVPGNHDRHGELDLDSWAKALGGGISQNYQCKVFELPNDRFVFFFLLNSTLARTPDPITQHIHDIVQVRGWIDKGQIAWLRRVFSYLKDRHRTEFEKGLKVAVLHHHLIPVGSESYLGDAFMTLGNANEVLGVLADMKVDLVLHGHKHTPAIRSHRMEERNHRLIVLSAGSATAYTGERLRQAEEDTDTISSQCSFFSLDCRRDAIAVRQYDYSNRIHFPNKFIPTWRHEFYRDIPEYSRFEVDMAWTIHFPSTDWDVTESYLVQSFAGGRETFTFDLGCTEDAKFSDLGVKVYRKFSGRDAQATLPDKEPTSSRYEREGEVFHYFEVPVKLAPLLAAGLDRDQLTIAYKWPRGFFEFTTRNYVEGSWGYRCRIDRLKLIVRFTGQCNLKELRVLAPGQQRPVLGQREQGGGLVCEVANLPANATITYVIERE